MKKLFTNDKFYLIVTILAVVCELGYALLHFSAYANPPFSLLFRIACVICLYISYINHSKNVMKGMMGALLAAQLMTAFMYITEIDTSASYIFGTIYLVLSFLLFVNHFIINSNRKASPIMISLNKIILALLVIDNTIWSFYFLPENIPAVAIFIVLLDIVGFACLNTTVICVESRLDAYRLDREAAGWTEEAGYPEGYVHEYEKKDNK